MLKRVCLAIVIINAFALCVVLSGDESSLKYFPTTVDSFWVYEDQDGNEFTRRAVEGEEIADEVYFAFNYEPEIENWIGYSHFFIPSLYKISDAGIVFSGGNEVEKVVKAQLQTEMDRFADIVKADTPPDAVIDIDVEVKTQDQMTFLIDSIVENEEWDVNEYDAKITMGFSGGGLAPMPPVIINFHILETGMVVGKETVEISAGTFEDCIKVVYRTESTFSMIPQPPPEEVEEPVRDGNGCWERNG